MQTWSKMQNSQTFKLNLKTANKFWAQGKSFHLLPYISEGLMFISYLHYEHFDGYLRKNCLNTPLAEPTGIFKILLMKKNKNKPCSQKKWIKEKAKRKERKGAYGNIHMLMTLVFNTPYFMKVGPEIQKGWLTYPTSHNSKRQGQRRQWVETTR